MNQNDQTLIMELSTKLKQSQDLKKDKEAQALITQEIAQQPDAVYLLTQTVLIQQQAIIRLQEQINALKTQQSSKRGFFSRLLGNQNAGYATPPYQAAPRSPFGQGSFLSSALTTAAGVAGGMFLFEGLSHLLGGGTSSNFSEDSMLNHNAMADPFQGQDQDLNDGFGNGDSFMDDSSSDLGSSDFGSDFDDGFGSGDF